MILRRLVANLKQQQWTSVAIELGIVVLGVFIGLQASNWDQVRKDRDAGREVLDNLASDYADIERDAQAYSATLETRRNGIREVLALIRGPEPVVDAVELSTRFEPVLRLPLSVGESATQQEITYSGRWHVIADRELRSLLIAQSELARATQTSQQARREFARPYLVPITRLQALLGEEYPPDKAIALAGGLDELRIALQVADGVYASEVRSTESVLASLKTLRARLEQVQGASAK